MSRALLFREVDTFTRRSRPTVPHAQAKAISLVRRCRRALQSARHNCNYYRGAWVEALDATMRLRKEHDRYVGRVRADTEALKKAHAKAIEELKDRIDTIERDVSGECDYWEQRCRAIEDEQRLQQQPWCAALGHDGGYRCRHCGYDWRPVTW